MAGYGVHAYRGLSALSALIKSCNWPAQSFSCTISCFIDTCRHGAVILTWPTCGRKDPGTHGRALILRHTLFSEDDYTIAADPQLADTNLIDILGFSKAQYIINTVALVNIFGGAS